MAKSMWGFGSPGAPSAAGKFDFGFGSKAPAAWDPADGVDFGFGDAGAAAYNDPAALAPGVHWYPDDGGVVLTIYCSGFLALISSVYRIKVKHVGSGVTYPQGGAGLRSPVPGSGADIPVELDGKRLRCCLPPLPLGDYTILLYWGANFEQSKELVVNAFEVVFRHHSREQFGIRRRLPPHWLGAGPRDIVMEPPLVNPSTEWAHPTLQALTRAFAEQVQLFGGKAVTRLTADFAEGVTVAQVETTLGFPDNGVFHCPGRVRSFTYTGRTQNTFTGCAPLNIYEPTAVAAGSEVVAGPEYWAPLE